GRKADPIAARDDGFRWHAGGSHAGGPYPRLQQDLGAELFDDLYAGIETKARGAIAEHEVLRPHAQDHAAAVMGLKRRRIGSAYRQPKTFALDRHSARFAAHGDVDKVHCGCADKTRDELVGGLAV